MSQRGTSYSKDYRRAQTSRPTRSPDLQVGQKSQTIGVSHDSRSGPTRYTDNTVSSCSLAPSHRGNATISYSSSSQPKTGPRNCTSAVRSLAWLHATLTSSQELHDSSPSANSNCSQKLFAQQFSCVQHRVKFWFLLCVWIWFDMLLNSVFFSMNRMWNVVPLKSVGENFVINLLGSQFQAQQASMNLLIKSGLLGHFWTKNAVCFPKKHWTEEGLG
jgi:hypothetical protein